MHGEGGGRSLSAGVGWRGWERGEAGVVTREHPGCLIILESSDMPPFCSSKLEIIICNNINSVAYCHTVILSIIQVLVP